MQPFLAGEELLASQPGEIGPDVDRGRFLALDPSIEQGKRAWFSPDNASITEFRFATNPYRPGAEPAWEMVRFNDAAHLAGDRSGLVA